MDGSGYHAPPAPRRQVHFRRMGLNRPAAASNARKGSSLRQRSRGSPKQAGTEARGMRFALQAGASGSENYSDPNDSEKRRRGSGGLVKGYEMVAERDSVDARSRGVSRRPDPEGFLSGAPAKPYGKDEIVQGAAEWTGGKGGVIGCTVHSSDRSRYEPTSASRGSCVSRGDHLRAAAEEEAKRFSLEFLEAVPSGRTFGSSGPGSLAGC